VVFGHTDNVATTGWSPDFTYAGGGFGQQLELLNSSDEIQLFCKDGAGAEQLFDQVVYATTGGWPTNSGGTAIQLDPTLQTTADNDAPAAWCQAKTAFSGGDRGTPGAANVPCNPCSPNPCDAPPAAACTGQVLSTYALTGTCADVSGVAACSYPPIQTDCAALGGTCDPSGCQGVPPAPSAGEVLITEVMYNPAVPADNSAGEWVELHNPTGAERLLTGCTVTDGEGQHTITVPLTIAAGGYVVLAAADNGATTGWAPADVYGNAMSLANTGDEVELHCPAPAGGSVPIAQLQYQAGGMWPSSADGVAVALDPQVADPTYATWGEYWCHATAAYGGGDLGTPGAPNAICDAVVDWCRLQSPASVAVAAGAPFTVYARVDEAGITELTPAQTIDVPVLMAQIGYGPDGSNPSVDDTGWIWAAATPNYGYDDATEPDYDEYQADVSISATGPWDYAARFSRDGGLTWLTCDRDATGNGYDPAQAGDATVN
jgi:hypothetical protein